jgi:hypothetical protein
MQIPPMSCSLSMDCIIKNKIFQITYHKIVKDNIYIVRQMLICLVFFNTGLHVSHCLNPIITLTALFYKRKILLASGELPQKTIQYLMTEWKYVRYIILSVSLLLQNFIFLNAKHALPSLGTIDLTCVFHTDLLGFWTFSIVWLRLALSKGSNWVGVFSPTFTWGRRQIQFPKHRVL